MTNSLHWFRKGLRVHDNPALLAANDGAAALYPVFCLDPWFLDRGHIGPNRINFLLESLSDLDNSLRERGSRLIVLYGKPLEVIPVVAKLWGVGRLCFEKDTEPYALERDAAITKLLSGTGIKVCPFVSHTLFDSDAVLAQNGGKVPANMGEFTKLVTRMGPVAEPLDAPGTLAAPANVEAAKEWLRGGTGAVPSLKDLGLEPVEGVSTPFRGGETEGLERLKRHLVRTQWVCEFEKPKGNPASFEPTPATTVLSPYLKFGCVSARLFHQELQRAYAQGGKHTKPPVSLEGQLLWREFFYVCGAGTPNFHKMVGNPECRQIPWLDNPDFIHRWEYGQTGYPWIDAVMNQLRTWGWMHHLARHAVACFLTRGDLWCSWEAGRDIFDKYLIDGDHFVNTGNWQWLSCSNFFYQYFRCYSPVTFGKKYDKEGTYIRHFVPALKDFPSKYIYEPWTAPLSVQQAANCVIGKDYPEPIVDHKVALGENSARMKAAYAAHREAGGKSGQGAGSKRRLEGEDAGEYLDKKQGRK